MPSPTIYLSPQRKKFLMLICGGMQPEEAATSVWPLVRNIPEHMARVMSDEHFKEAYAYLISHRYSKEALLQKSIAIVDDKKARPSERVFALKLAAQIAGHISKEVKPKTKKDSPKNTELADRLVQLAGKAAHGHQKQAVS